MSAVLKDQPEFAKMRVADLAEVVAVESAIYTHPWTPGNFTDSLNSRYDCATYRLGVELIGYFVVFVAVGEAHLLNLSVAANRQRQGVASTLLREAMRVARERRALEIFLEVRPSNAAALALYAGFSFKQIGFRRDYYPGNGASREGRESALVLALGL